MIKYLIFTLLPFVLLGQDIDYKYAGEPYYPEEYLEKQDSLKWPIIVDITIDVKDIKGLDNNEDKFFSKLVVSSFSEYDYEYITNLGKSIDLSHEEFFYLDYKENSLTSIVEFDPRTYKKSKYEYLFYDKFFSKTVKLIEAPFDHNWNLRDFPFDEQKLKYRFTAHMDTSAVRLRPSSKFKSSFNKSMKNLKEGFNVKEVTFNHTYNIDRHDPIMISPGLIRPIVTETLEIILILDRQGSWLFLKLFMGGILSFFISCMIFLMPLHKELESKVTLGVGAVFGAIGNRYFVDSTLEGVQTFTKADAISNLIILMVVLNILIAILQNSKYTYFSFFQSKVNTLFYSIYAFVILLLAVLMW